MRRNNRGTIPVLLALMAAMNASQTMVVCVGSDGHVAIEPVGHKHCADGTHLCESDAAVHDMHLGPDSQATRCAGCTDFPMADELGGDPRASATSKTVSACSLVIVPAAQNPPTDSVGIDLLASAPPGFYHLPLDSIVLQV